MIITKSEITCLACSLLLHLHEKPDLIDQLVAITIIKG